jgi:PAS domain S-box-containing protein
MKRKDGSEIWVEDHGHYVHDKQGNIIYHEGILRDVTERKRLESELKRYSTHLEEMVRERSGRLAESEARYRRLFESSPISLWEEDFSEVKKYFDNLRSRGVKDLRRYFIEHPDDLAKCASMVKILNVNETTLNMYGAKSVEELSGELRRVFTTEFQDNFREELVALGEGKTFASEFDNQTLTGDIKHVNLILNVVPGYEDTLAKVLVSIIDLTERKKMEQRLQQAERLAAVGETAAMVGHDLRNPLQGMAAAVHLLRQESLTAEERNEMMQLIEKSIHYSDSIIRDLSDYSAEIQLKLAEATPNLITGDAIGAIKVPQNVTVRNLSEDQPTLRVDLDRMRRVFINLIENAIDAMPQGGTITISSRRSDGKVEIALTDTGSGISEKVMGNLWKPLQTTKAKGLGLGLAICRRIVDAHGGSMSVKSEVGRGTALAIQLPIRPLEVKQK